MRLESMMPAGALALALAAGWLASEVRAASSTSAREDAANLSARLSGTTWDWSNSRETITFGADGLCRVPNWDGRGLVTRWTAIDRHTVLLTLERGRDADRYAICVFDAEFTEFSGHNFHGCTAIFPSRRIDDR